MIHSHHPFIAPRSLWITTNSFPSRTSNDGGSCVLNHSQGLCVCVCVFVCARMCTHNMDIYIRTYTLQTHLLGTHTKILNVFTTWNWLSDHGGGESQGLHSVSWSTGEPTLQFQSESESKARRPTPQLKDRQKQSSCSLNLFVLFRPSFSRLNEAHAR